MMVPCPTHPPFPGADYTLHSTPYTLHPTPYTQQPPHHIPNTEHPAPNHKPAGWYGCAEGGGKVLDMGVACDDDGAVPGLLAYPQAYGIQVAGVEKPRPGAWRGVSFPAGSKSDYYQPTNYKRQRK